MSAPPEDPFQHSDDDAPDAPPRSPAPAPAAPEKGKRSHLRLATKADSAAPEWHQQLRREPTKQGMRIVRSTENVRAALAHAPEWQAVVRWNEMSGRRELAGALPQGDRGSPVSYPPGNWADHHTFAALTWFAPQLGWEPSSAMLEAALDEHARRSSYHPVRDYLTGLKWDGTPRCNQLLARYFGAEPSPLLEAMGSRWMISAVARVMRPGCQADHMLVAEGPQGCGKTTGLHALVGASWICSSPIDLRDKDAAMVLRGCWVYDFDELDSIRGRDATRVKSFVTLAQDSYRPAYGRQVVDVPRSCVFVGTTNEDQYLSDPTGNRRIWPFRCGAIDVPGLAKDRDQLWAEAVVRFGQGEPWHLDTQELQQAATVEQSSRLEEDPWVSTLQDWWTGNLRRFSGVTVQDALTELEIPNAQQGKREQNRVGACLRKMGLVKQRVMQGGTREYIWVKPQNTVCPSSETSGGVGGAEEGQHFPEQ